MKHGLNRRSFLQRAGLAGMTSPGWSQTSSPNRPNVLLTMADQQTDEAMGCTGNQ